MKTSRLISSLSLNRSQVLFASPSFIAMAIGLIVIMIGGGCRTAASLGLPVSSGNSYLLDHAAKVRSNFSDVTGVPTEMAKAPLQPHRIEAGDMLVIEPNDFNSAIRFQSDQTVQQDGTIDLGSYGVMSVAGMSTAEIQTQVESNIISREARKREPGVITASFQSGGASDVSESGVSVRLVSQESGNVYVMGEVNAPGSYPITGSETVLDAIISAGGLATNSNEFKIILTRPQLGSGPRIVLPVLYQDILQLGDVSTNYQLQPGDRVYVPSMTVLEDVRQSLQWKKEDRYPMIE